MSTGASRLIRSVWPYTYSSATRSPTTAMRGERGGRSRAGGLAEEIDEDAARRPHVLIDDHPQRLPPPEQPQRRVRGSLLGELAHPALPPPRGEDRLVEAASQGARDRRELHPPLHGGAGHQLPVAEVGDSDHHSATFGAGRFIAFPV